MTKAVQRKTAGEIAAEVKALKALRGRIRSQTAFGDDNNAALEAGIEVLEQRLSEDAIYDLWDNDEFVLGEALGARYWADGHDEDGAPSEGWGSLVIG